MREELLLEEHLNFLRDKYEYLYERKFPWAVKELQNSLVNDHIRRVVAEIDEEKYLKQIREVDISTAPIDIPQTQ